MNETTCERVTGSWLPGSAWDTWHLHGFEWAASNPDASGAEIEAAAQAFWANDRQCFKRQTVVKAFTMGAQQITRKKG